MKMVNCQFCGSQIKKKSSTCANCGGPVSKAKPKKTEYDNLDTVSAPTPTIDPVVIGKNSHEASFWDYLCRLYLFSLPFSIIWVFTSYPLLSLIHLSPMILFLFGHMFYTMVIDPPSGDI